MSKTPLLEVVGDSEKNQPQQSQDSKGIKINVKNKSDKEIDIEVESTPSQPQRKVLLG